MVILHTLSLFSVNYQTKVPSDKRCEKSLISISNYTHAVLACYGVSVLWIVDKCHIDSNQRCSIGCQHLTSDYRHQARQTETDTDRQA